jgi:DNA-binding NarL/FixJ family response regulator
MSSLINVAIAEDQAIVRKGIVEIVHTFGGFVVNIEASDGQDLCEKLEKAKALPDILILDISMKGWDGYQTIDEVKKKWPEIKILILTMHTHEFAIIKMLRSGANGYLLKDCHPKELKKALQSIHDTGLYFSDVASSNLYHRLMTSNVIPTLSEKEMQLLRLSHTDLTYNEIAAKMGVSERSIGGLRSNLFEKFKVNSRAALVSCAIQMGLTQNN